MRRLNVWPPLPLDAHVRRPRSNLPFPLEDPRCRLFSRARNGLAEALAARRLGAGDSILTPTYHHGSEIEALEATGLRCVFYNASPSLEPSEEELDRLLVSDTRALYLIHYLGFPQDAPRWRKWCDERGLLLIEDAAQAWLAHFGSSPVGSWGDISIFCLYKTYGLPDASAVVSTPPPDIPDRRDKGVRSTLLQHRAWVLGRIGTRRAISSEPDGYDPSADFALASPRAPSRAAMYLLPRLIDGGTAERRRANMRYLAERLEEYVVPWARPFEGSSPFALPIEVDDKMEARRSLMERGVIPLDFWSVGHPSAPMDAATRSLRRHLLGLPVHQELQERDLDQIVSAVIGARLGRTLRNT